MYLLTLYGPDGVLLRDEECDVYGWIETSMEFDWQITGQNGVDQVVFESPRADGKLLYMVIV